MVDAYITSIFLYNSELWSLNKNLESTVDVIQRNLLRRTLQIFWPKKISNAELYRITNQQPWSTTIQKRRLSWLGHLMRLNEQTPARRALEEYSNPEIKRPRGKPPITWMAMIRDDLQTINIKLNLNKQQETIQKLQQLTSNRQQWKRTSREIITKRQNEQQPDNQPN